jgi:shikimate dehydrogenase
MEERISGSTGLICLLGHPVAHSISPQMHNLAFSLEGLDYAYLAFDATEETFGTVVEGLKAMDCRGFNLTMPFKTAIIPYLDQLSPAAQLCHSVNTVVNEGGRLIGHSTDGVGYMESVKDAGYDIIGHNMTLLGAGGAATSICVQAALDGVREIYMFKRRNASFARAQAFCDGITAQTHAKVYLYDMADQQALANCLRKSAILVNATNVGMGEDRHSLVPKELLYPELIVSDIIYHPAITPLLAEAAEVGCPGFNGEYMLLYQGAEAFRLWTGRQMPVEKIKHLFTD